MREIEKSARTTEEAIDEALAELGLTKDEVEVEVLEEGTKGLFGLLGSKNARVKVKEILTPEKKAINLLKDIFKCMNLSVDLEAQTTGEHIKINLIGPDLGILIGRRGETLDALQYYLNLAANRNFEKRVRFVIDVENYRQRREDTLCKLAHRLADKVRRKDKEVILEPMSPYERRIIHTALQDNKDVFTYSEGEEPYRKIIIAPKK